MNSTPEQLAESIRVLRMHRHELVREATPSEDGSLVPMLKKSQTCCAIDRAIALLERELKAVAS